MRGGRRAEVRWASQRAFIQSSQVGPDTFIKDASQVVKHGSPGRWQRAEQKETTASVLPGRELVAQNGVDTSQKSLDFLGQLLSTVRRQKTDLVCWRYWARYIPSVSLLFCVKQGSL